MKKIGVLISLLVLTSALAMAQKYAFVDSEYIRKNIPAFNSAQDQLDKLSQQWEKEVADGYAVVEKMYKSYQNEAVLLSQDMKTKREEAIITKEKDIPTCCGIKNDSITSVNGNLLDCLQNFVLNWLNKFFSFFEEMRSSTILILALRIWASS